MQEKCVLDLNKQHLKYNLQVIALQTMINNPRASQSDRKRYMFLISLTATVFEKSAFEVQLAYIPIYLMNWIGSKTDNTNFI